MNNVLSLTYASFLTRLCEINSSFDSGVLHIAYPGKNRNESFISKETFEKCLKTIYNCPLVCNYDRTSDTLGGHDMEVVQDGSGSLKIVNITTPVGCVPESAETFWETVEEKDGTVREYLCAEVLLWKRQEAYQKIKKDGFAAQSMEITVKDGESIDGVYVINDFEFTAFALIGVEPCFESASLEFVKQDFKLQLSQMMLEIKESFSKVATSKEDDNIHLQKKYSTEGGEKVLKDKLDLIAKYGLKSESLSFSIDDINIEELEEKLKSFKANDSKASPKGKGSKSDVNYALEGNIRDELSRLLESNKVQKDWGECTKYWFVDYDKDAKEVYCWDTSDWLLYGFTYETDGDFITICYDSKKRKKFDIVDFDNGEQVSPVAQIFAMMESEIQSNIDSKANYEKAATTITSMKAELETLRQFKADTEAAITKNEKDKIFANFTDLDGVEAFEKLREAMDKYDTAVIEEKCYAIRGRNTVSKFSNENAAKVPKLQIDKLKVTSDPYGGIFQEYGIEVKE